ncbi:unnamed protein product [marine sediment metagenome]|uniref:Uncharacterized protein n=1 Tax=marine sediment metagenome TaxID=412755 RepID=X1RGT8_9ZZZZ
MPDINKPMDIPELNLQPPITGKIRLGEDMVQTLALLCAMGDSKRITLRASESGVLQTVTPRIKSLWGATSSGDPSTKQGDDIPCNEVMILGHPDNDVKIWVRPHAVYVPTGDNANIAWPVGAGEVVSFVVSNLNHIWFYFEGATDKVIVAYTE